MPAPFTIKKSRYSEFRDIVNKRSLTRSFVISKFGCNSICKNQTLTADRLMQSLRKDKFVWNFKKETFIVRSSATDISCKYFIFS